MAFIFFFVHAKLEILITFISLTEFIKMANVFNSG